MPDKTDLQRNSHSIALVKKTMYKQQAFNVEEALHPIGRDACTATVHKSCSIAELHGDIYSPTTGLGNDVIDNDGKHLVSDTMFRGLLPPELRVMSNHYKTVCCCEFCQGFNCLQSALNSFCVQLLATMVKEL